MNKEKERQKERTNNEVGAPSYNFFTASDPFVEIITGIILFVPIMCVAILTISPFLAKWAIAPVGITIFGGMGTA